VTEIPHVDGVTHREVDLGGLRLHVAEAGSGEPLVMLHGWPQHWWEWRHLIPPLAEEYHVVCPDLRGFGWSDAPPGGYSKEELAGDAIALIDELGLERVRLVGHDWGGFIGFLICLRHPERVERYLALNTGHPFRTADARVLVNLWRFWYQAAISTPLLGRLLVQNAESTARLLRWLGIDDTPWSDEERELFLGSLRDPARARATVELYRTFLVRELPAVARGRYAGARLRTPTLFLHGAADPALRPPTLRGYEENAEDMTLELVEGVGHFIADERPDLVLARAREHFAG
jgi:pimeloyl-ACP methyl ester carboxylesterase